VHIVLCSKVSYMFDIVCITILLHCQGHAYLLSNHAALRIVTVSTDVLFNTIDNVFITGLCRTVAGVGCTSVPGISQTDEVSDCDVISGRVISLHHVTSMQLTRLWKLVGNSTATEQECGSKSSTLQLAIITFSSLLSLICCFTLCRHKPFSVLLQGK